MMESCEHDKTSASEIYARLEHLRSSRPQASVASEDDERKRSAESGFASAVPSEKDYNGTRVNKYTARSETLYFNQFYAMRFDNLVGYGSGQAVKHIYLGDTRIVTKLNTVRSGTWSEEVKKQYFYHSDHLGSASLISDCDGKEYQRIEYTPYGETWVEKTSNTGMEYLPYKFTGKERDEETGLYYFGARYLDPQYSRWLSTDPALGEYVPLAPLDDEAKKHNSNLPGMGGVFNMVNLHLYHYSANNPVTYTDPNDDFIVMVGLTESAGGGVSGISSQGVYICVPTNGGDAKVGIYASVATGSFFGYGAALSGTLTLAPFANEFSDIGGYSNVIGGSANVSMFYPAFPIKTPIGVDVGMNTAADSFLAKLKSTTISLSVSIASSPGSIGEGHMLVVGTFSLREYSLKDASRILDDINKFIEKWDFDGLKQYACELYNSKQNNNTTQE